MTTTDGPTSCRIREGLRQAGVRTARCVGDSVPRAGARRDQMRCRGSPATIAAAAVPRIGPSAGDTPAKWAIIAPAYQAA